MSYFLRILSPSAQPISALPVIQRLKAQQLSGIGLACTGDQSAWTSLLIRHGQEGSVIAEVERLLVRPGSPGEQELSRLIRVAELAQPLSASAWLSSLLPSVQTVWGINLYAGLNEPGGWEALGAVKDAIWGAVGGIQYVTDEGFTNEEGYQVTWEFPPDATGTWWMAMMKEGAWSRFEADRGNPLHKALFESGRIPV
ncbi:MAG TPA: hypothetical protein VK191_12520 [Symbiobacteriaceae bacterium]|nr:hypothetical protein [Symbiobacteriaceae bacterium]